MDRLERATAALGDLLSGSASVPTLHDLNLLPAGTRWVTLKVHIDDLRAAWMVWLEKQPPSPKEG
jgi:hypothetical protein